MSTWLTQRSIRASKQMHTKQSWVNFPTILFHMFNKLTVRCIKSLCHEQKKKHFELEIKMRVNLRMNPRVLWINQHVLMPVHVVEKHMRNEQRKRERVNTWAWKIRESWEWNLWFAHDWAKWAKSMKKVFTQISRVFDFSDNFATISFQFATRMWITVQWEKLKWKTIEILRI